MNRIAQKKELDFQNLISFVLLVIWQVTGVLHLKKRHNNISLRTPETTASVRHEMVTRVREPYFISLKAEMDNHEITNKASVIWNMDKTCITLFSDSEKIVARSTIIFKN